MSDDRVHPTRPCANCPYRKDAPLKLWHASEFRKVLANERAEIGIAFACHKQSTLPSAKRGLCAGWMLDQKKRDVPCIAARLALSRMGDPLSYMRKLNSKGLKLFRTVEAMCRANGVKPPPKSTEPDPYEKFRRHMSGLPQRRSKP